MRSEKDLDANAEPPGRGTLERIPGRRGQSTSLDSRRRQATVQPRWSSAAGPRVCHRLPPMPRKCPHRIRGRLFTTSWRAATGSRKFRRWLLGAKLSSAPSAKLWDDRLGSPRLGAHVESLWLLIHDSPREADLAVAIYVSLLRRHRNWKALMTARCFSAKWRILPRPRTALRRRRRRYRGARWNFGQADGVIARITRARRSCRR